MLDGGGYLDGFLEALRWAMRHGNHGNHRISAVVLGREHDGAWPVFQAFLLPLIRLAAP